MLLLDIHNWDTHLTSTRPSFSTDSYNSTALYPTAESIVQALDSSLQYVPSNAILMLKIDIAHALDQLIKVLVADQLGCEQRLCGSY